MQKTEVREIAERLELPNAAKKDSTGICFIGERPFREFLNRYLPTKPGPMVTDTGDVVGEHMGLSFYTLGQRKGLGIGGVKNYQSVDGTAPAWFVARKDLESNTLYVVNGHDHPWLMSTELVAEDVSWVSGQAPSEDTYSVKTRYRQADVPCHFQHAENGFKLNFPEAQWAVPPGQ